VTRILDARKQRKAGWAKTDKAQQQQNKDKGEGSSKKKD
jgi:hypothetical protein